MPIPLRPRSPIVAWLMLVLLAASCGDGGDTEPARSPSAPSGLPASTGTLTCESLDTLTAGAVIQIGPPPTNSYQPPLMDIAARPFTWSNGTSTSAGQAITDNAGKAGGAGVEIGVNNLTLSVSRGFGQVLQVARLSFGEYGGNINVVVNNVLTNIDNFAALHNKMIGGVHVTVLSGGLGNDAGAVEFQGQMTDQNSGLGQLAVGGQELWIDNICFQH